MSLSRRRRMAIAASLATLLLAIPAGGPAHGDENETRVGYLRIEGAIDRLQARYLARALEDARAARLDTLVVHLDTDGGEVKYAREMFRAVLEAEWETDAARADATPRPRLIAFVDFRALSAGAMIAYAHHELHLTQGASIGDIGVIYQRSDGTIEYAPEKMETVVRTLLVHAAEQRGWPRGLLLKMIARNQNLYRITPPGGGGEVVYVIEDEFPAWLAAHPEIDPDDTAQVLVYRGHDRLLTLTGSEAVALGMATSLVEDLDALYAKLGIAPDTVLDLQLHSSERTAAWLAGIAPLLMGLAILFLFFEVRTPGVGLWALLGAIFGGLFLFAQFFLELVTYYEVLLLVAGVALIALEFLLLPTGGIIAIAGGLMVLTGMVLSFLPNELDFAPDDPAFRDAMMDAVVSGLVSLAVTGVGAIVLFRLLARATRLRRLFTVEAEIGGTSETDLHGTGPGATPPLPPPGATGHAFRPLHPSGTVVIDGHHHNARAEHGAWIGEGEPILVVATELGELIVRPHPPPDAVT